MIKKKCYRCQDYKEVDNFYDDFRNKDGKKGVCKQCLTASKEVDREKHLAYHKEYRRRPEVMAKNRQRSIDNWHKRKKERDEKKARMATS